MGTSIGFDVFAKDRASGTFDKVGNSAQRSGGKLRAIGRIGKMAGLGLAAGVGAAAYAGAKLAKAAAEDEQSARSMAVAFRNNAGATRSQIAATEAWITKQGLAKGVADDALRPALSKLIVATHDVGKAQSLAGLAMDASAGTGKDLGAVSMALAKAQGGNVGALSRLGIATKDARGKTISFDQAVKKMSATFRGQASAAAETTAGKYARAKLAFSEAGEALGYKLLPPVTAVATWLVGKGIPAMERFGGVIGEYIGPAAKKVGELFKSFSGDGGGASKLATDVKAIGASIKPLVEQYGGTAKDTFVEIGRALASVGSVVKTDLIPAVRTIMPVVRPVASAIMSVFGNNVITAVRIVGGVIKGFVTSISGVLNVVGGLLTGNWGKAWKGLGQMARGSLGAIGAVVGGLFGMLRRQFGPVLKTLLGAAWRGAWNGLKAAPRVLLSAVRGLIVRGVTGWVSVVRGAGGKLAGGIRSAVSSAASAARALPGKVKGAVGGLGSLLSGVGRDVVSGFVSGIRNSAGRVVSAARELASHLPKWVRKVLDIHSPSRVMMRLGSYITEGLAKGMLGGGFQKLTKARSRVLGAVKKLKSDLSKLYAKRDDFAAGFNYTSSIFGADYGEQGPTTGGILAYQQRQLAEAQQSATSVKRLVGLGLSTSLIKQLQASGDSGLATLRSLGATATADDIARLNAMDKQTQAAYQSAGMTAANAVYGKQIASTRDKLADAKMLARELGREIREHGGTVVVKIDGNEIIRATKSTQRKKGK